MASRPLAGPFPVIANASMTTTVISLPTIIQNLSMIGYDISWSGSPTGTFSVQVSNTYSENAAGQTANPGTWTTITLSSPTAATGTSGSGFIDIDAMSAYAIRLVYTAASGTGTLNAVLSAKVA